MNTSEDLHIAEAKETLDLTSSQIKKLQEQYQKGELSSTDTLEALRALLANFN